MKLLISSTSAGVNLSLDPALASHLTGVDKSEIKDGFKVNMSFVADTVTVVCDPCGVTCAMRDDSFRCRFSFGRVKEYPKHGKMFFGDGGYPLYVGNRIIKFAIPKILPLHHDLVRGPKGKCDALVPLPQISPVSRSANLVMTVGDMTLCYNVPQQELLELTFNLTHKGYAVR